MMNIWEAIALVLIMVFCTPMGWMGLLILGMIGLYHGWVKGLCKEK